MRTYNQVDISIALYNVGANATLESIKKYVDFKYDETDRKIYYYAKSKEVEEQLSIVVAKKHTEKVVVFDYFKLQKIIRIIKDYTIKLKLESER